MDWPKQAKVAQVTTRNATLIRKAFDESINVDAVVAAWDESHPDKKSMTTSMARSWALANVRTKKKPLELALSRLYADGYTLGDSIARSRLLAMVVKSVGVNTVDWSTWTPGMESSAALIRPTGGLQELLRTRKIQITDDVLRTKLDRIGTKLADSLERGLSSDETAKALREVVNDPQHALMIARTEMARSMSVASRDTYEKSNVEQVEWLVAEGCEDCQENADASPIGIDETFPTGDSEPPAHPNCMCAIAPVFDDSNLPEAPEPEAVDAEQDFEFVDTGSDMAEYYEEVSDSIAADELSRYQNYDPALNELLGLDKPQGRLEGGSWDRFNLTPEGKAVAAYKGEDYQNVNNYLRFGPDSVATSGARAWAKDIIGKIDKAMEIAPPLPKPIMTYRGVVLGENNFLGQLKVGDVFEDKGFGSTSLYKDFSKEWTKEQYGSWLIEIENPAGTKGLMLDGLKYQRASEEAEWLLDRGAQFEVIATDSINNVLRVRVKNG